MRKYLAILIFSCLFQEGLLAQNPNSDSSHFYFQRKLNMDFGLQWRSYSKPFENENMRQTIFNLNNSRAIGFQLGLNFCLNEHFHLPKTWSVRAIYSGNYFPISGTLVLNQEDFGLSYDHRFDVFSSGYMSRFGIGINRRKNLKKPNLKFQFGLSMGYSFLTHADWQTFSEIEDLVGISSEVIYNIQSLDGDPKNQKMDFVFNLGFINQTKQGTMLEYGLEFMPAVAAWQTLNISSARDVDGVLNIRPNFIGFHMVVHPFRTKVGERLEKRIIENQNKEEPSSF